MNLHEGREFHAAGLVRRRYAKLSASGKDLFVTFLDPFLGDIRHEWRSDDEIEIYHVDPLDWEAQLSTFNKIEEAVSSY